MKKTIEKILKYLAKKIIAEYQPEVIGITGSVGKTSTRDAVYAVLKGKFSVRKSEKNYNNELGLPLTVIGCDSPGSNPVGWFKVIYRGWQLSRRQDRGYPKILVLEMGVDRPGDMDYLLSIVRPKIGILTLAGTVHAEYFKDREELRKEKTKLITGVPKDSYNIINYDNEGSRRSIKDSAAKVISFGQDENAQVRAQEIRMSYRGEEIAQNLQGISFKLTYKGSFVPVLVPGVLGVSAVYAVLAGAAAGLAKGMNLVEIAEAIRSFAPPRGRMLLINGIKGTAIIDDTYNAEPESMLSALGALRRINVGPGAKRYAVLGDMLELGTYSEEEHKNIGRYLAKSKIDVLIAVGERARDIARGAKEAGQSEDRIFEFADSATAGKFLQDRLRPGDLILAKGSQGMRMERVVLELMAEPIRAGELLVRQDAGWT